MHCTFFLIFQLDKLIYFICFCRIYFQDVEFCIKTIPYFRIKINKSTEYKRTSNRGIKNEIYKKL